MNTLIHQEVPFHLSKRLFLGLLGPPEKEIVRSHLFVEIRWNYLCFSAVQWRTKQKENDGCVGRVIYK